LSGIYIHVPFCKQACTYCDFYFETSRKHREGFVEALKREIAWEAQSTGRLQQETINTIYLGGGTPSVLEPGEVGEILEALGNVARISEDAEITLEMNPDDVQPGQLKAMMSAGINRFSMGVQTFNERRLHFMNRAHSREEALTALEALADSGCKSWTADLIYGNPGQSEEDLAEDVKTLLGFQPPHISAYSLTVEPHTRLGSMVRKNLVKPAEDDLVARHMDLIVQRFRDKGLMRYETSNYARPGHESRHNAAYWRHINYLGFGPSAHSFWWEQGDGIAAPTTGLRWRNTPRLDAYIRSSSYPASDNQPPIFREEPDRIKLHELAEERLLIGLRTRDGVQTQELQQRYGYKLSEQQWHYLRQMQDEGYIIIKEQLISNEGNRQVADEAMDAITLSETGMLMADYLALELITRH
jgi:oxygen-independent coproporphyrinogen-3 oxidase